MRTYFKITAMLSLVLLAAGCRQKEAPRRPPVSVKVTEARLSAITEGQAFSGTVEEAAGSALSFPVAGTVCQVMVSEGQRVSSGTLIATLDVATLQDTHDAAVATLEQAEDAYQRMRQLHDNGSLPEMQWVEVQSRLRQAQSAERIARKSLADGRLYAPFAGVIAEKSVETGQNVLPGTPVVRLVAVSEVKVSISVPENEIASIRQGQQARVTVKALDGRSFTGKITEKGISANPLSRCYQVKALVANPSGELMPGMICELRLSKEGAAEAMTLPCQVVQIDEENRSFVWIARQGKAHKRVIETGTLTNDGVTVTQGLAAGELVITEGWQKVSEGTAIKVNK